VPLSRKNFLRVKALLNGFIISINRVT